MVNVEHDDLAWLTAAPLWSQFRDDRGLLARPTILRFETDEFMEELVGLLARPKETDRASSLANKIARYRRYGAPPDGAPSDWAIRRPAGAALKLYQPVHGHFHLVVASLVCEVVGRPDHTVAPAHVGFVMRRLANGGGDELAWVPMSAVEAETAAKKKAEVERQVEGQGEIPPALVDDLAGAEAGHVWRPVPNGSGRVLVDGEEILPAFPVPFTDVRGHPRKLWAALVPASNPEARLLAKVDGATWTSERTFLLRAVLHRPDCPPSHRLVMSERSEVFRIASFVDPDAPARASFIPLPKLSKTPDLLRRFSKRARFVVQTQMNIDGNASKPKDMVSEMDPSLPAMVCSMSIPIITVCAYILLTIMLYILEYIFHWLPFIKVCFPATPQLTPEED